MKMTPLQQYLIIGAVVLVGILWGYYQFLWKPVNVEIQKLTVTRDQKKKELEEAKKIVARYAEFKKQAATVRRELEWFESRIPKQLPSHRFVEVLNLLQQRSRVTFTNLSFAGAKARDLYTEMPATVAFTTDYQGLLSFLYQVSVAEIYLVVNNLTVSSLLSDKDDTMKVQLAVRGVVSK